MDEEGAVHHCRSLELLKNLPAHPSVSCERRTPPRRAAEGQCVPGRNVAQVSAEIEELVVAHEVYHAPPCGWGLPSQAGEERVEVTGMVTAIHKVPSLHER